MAEVIQNDTEQNTTTNTTDSPKSSKPTSANTLTSLKQSKIGFLPRKKVVPTLLKKDSSTPEKKPQDSKINETSKNSNDKSPAKKTNKSDVVKKASPSKTGKHEENGGIKQNGKNTTPSKKSSNLKKDDTVISDIVPLLKLDKAKVIDNSKSSKSKSSKEKSSKELDSDKHSKNASNSKPSSPVKKSTTPVKKTSSALKKPTVNVKTQSSISKTLPDSTSNSAAKTSSDINSNSSSSNTNSAAVPSLNSSTKSRLLPTMKGNINSPVEVKSSDEEDDDMSLSQLRKKFTPVKLNDFASGVPNKVNKNTPLNINLVSNQRANTPSNRGKLKLNQTLEAIYNRTMQANGPIQNAMKSIPVVPGKPTPPPLNPIPTKNIIIAIDMDPQKWKSLSPQEQTRIIEHKKELARKHMLTMNKIPVKGIGSPNQNTHIMHQNHSPVTPPLMNVHPSKLSALLTSQNTYHNKSNLLISPTSAMNIHSNQKPSYSVNTVSPRHSLASNSYLGPRAPTFPTHVSQMSPRVGHHQGQNLSMQQMQEFNRQFNFKHNVKQEESTLTDLKPLPLTKKIPMPPGFPNECFGDIAMIVEFVNTFRSFLMQNIKLDADTLMIGVSPGSDKADIVSHILLLFLKILLSNEDYKVRGLKMELADLPLTEFTVSFLVCQLIKSQLETKKKLRKEKENAEKAAIVAEKVADLDISLSPSELSESDGGIDAAYIIDSDDEDDNGCWTQKKKKKKIKDVDVLESKLTKIASQLESREFWMLEATDQITVVTFLMDLILDSEDLSDYYNKVIEDKHKAYRDIDDQRKKKARVKMEKALVTLDQFTKKPVDNEKVNAAATDKKNADKQQDKNKEDESPKDAKSDPYAGMTQRQKEAIKSEMGRHENKKKEKEKQDAEQAKVDYQKYMDKLTVVLSLLKRVMRVEPLGEDRFHRLYWFFSDGIPGLYVSNLCVDIVLTHPLGGERPKERWSYYNKEEDINQLLCALTSRGLREEKLKSRIRGEHMAIVASIKEIKEIEVARKIHKKEKLEKSEEKVKKAEEKVKNAEEKVKNTEEKVKNTEEKVKNTEEKVHPSEEKENEMEAEEETINSVERKEEDNIEKIEVDGDGDKKEESEEGKKSEGEKEDGEGIEKEESDEVKQVDDVDMMQVDEGDKDTQKEDSEGDLSVGEGDLVVVVGDQKEQTEGDQKEQSDGDQKEEDNGDQKDVGKGDQKEEGKGDQEEEGKGDQEDEGKGDQEDEGKGDQNMEKATGEKQDKETIEIDDGEEDNEKLIDLVRKNADETDGENEDIVYDAHKTSIEALKSDIIESANRIVHGSLGELTELETWTERVSSVSDVEGLKEFVLQIQSCIVPKFFLSPFKATTEDISKDWCKWVEKCMTLSTMHMLYGLLENSIKWESSAEKMRCKVCRRKKGNESIEQIIVCDGCHLGYHSHCLRPPLNYIPEGEWKCPSCLPREERIKPKKTYHNEGKLSSDEGDKRSAESDHEELCHVCESDGMLILCDTCPLSFHLECHKPSLHHAPRGNWSCYECTNPRAKKRGNTKKITKTPVGKRGKAEKSKYVELSSDHDMSSDDNSETTSSEADFVPKKKKNKQTESNSTKANQKKKKNPPRKKRAVRNMEVSSSDDDDDDSDEEEESDEDEDSSSETSEQDLEPRGRRTKKTLANMKNKLKSDKSKSTKKKKKISSDEEEEEEQEEEEEKITADNLKSKIKKFNYKKKSRKRIKRDDDEENDSSKDNNKEDETDSSNNGGKESKEEWEKTQISPTLGNKRPCYAKDGLRKKEAKQSNTQKASSDNSPEKSEDDKKQEVLRNLSSADRSFRQAGRNSRRGCNYEMQACRNILVGLRKHKDSWPFLVPVNVKQAPDYLTIIEKPMDFSIVLKNLDDFIYDDVLQFVEDIKLVFENSKKYNLDTSLVGQAGVRLHEEFKALFKIHLPEVYTTFY